MAQLKVVADASIIAKWFLEERFSEKARELRDAYARGSVKVTVPTLLFYEALNALRESNVYSSTELQEAARALSLYGFESKNPTRKLMQISAKISAENDITIYDASYVALTQIKDIILYTADEELLRKFPERVKHIKDFREIGR